MPMKPNDFNHLAQRTTAMQSQFIQARSKLAEAEVTGTSGRVTLTLTATGDLRDIRIGTDAVDDIADLQQQILAAHRHATAALHDLAQDMMRPLQDLVRNLEDLDR